MGEETGKLSVLISDSGFAAWQADIAQPKGASEFERLVDVDTEPKPAALWCTPWLIMATWLRLISSGNVVWKREYSSYREFRIVGTTSYVVDSDGVIYALAKSSGIERWSQPALRGWYITGPAVLGDYLAVGDQEGNLHWLDRNSGELVARHEFDGSGFYVEPVVADDRLIIVTRDGEVSAVKAP